MNYLGLSGWEGKNRQPQWRRKQKKNRKSERFTKEFDRISLGGGG